MGEVAREDDQHPQTLTEYADLLVGSFVAVDRIGQERTIFSTLLSVTKGADGQADGLLLEVFGWIRLSCVIGLNKFRGKKNEKDGKSAARGRSDEV